MKNNVTTVFLMLFLSICTFSSYSQTVFELTPNTLGATVFKVRKHMANSGANYIPDSISMAHFFAVAFENEVYRYFPNACPKPGIRANALGPMIQFNFLAFGSGYPDMLWMGQMDTRQQRPSTFMTRGPLGYTNPSITLNNGSFRIFIVGSLCSSCPASPTGSCVSSWEIIIIEKSIF